jgi:hypothetical protein
VCIVFHQIAFFWGETLCSHVVDTNILEKHAPSIFMIEVHGVRMWSPNSLRHVFCIYDELETNSLVPDLPSFVENYLADQ